MQSSCWSWIQCFVSIIHSYRKFSFSLLSRSKTLDLKLTCCGKRVFVSSLLLAEVGDFVAMDDIDWLGALYDLMPSWRIHSCKFANHPVAIVAAKWPSCVKALIFSITASVVHRLAHCQILCQATLMVSLNPVNITVHVVYHSYYPSSLIAISFTLSILTSFKSW